MKEELTPRILKKIDLINEPIFVSAKNDEGIDELKEKINYYANIKFDKEEENNNNTSSHQSSLTRSFNNTVGLEDVNEDANYTCCENLINFFKIW